MKLFPHTASCRALESVASHAYDTWRTGPTAREQRQMDADERRHERACELARDAFELCDGLEVHEWLARDENREEIETLAVACIRQDDDLRRHTIDTLTERYVEARADHYMQSVLAEEQDAAEEAAADQWWEQTHG